MESALGERIKRLRNGVLMTQDDAAVAASVYARITDPARRIGPARTDGKRSRRNRLEGLDGTAVMIESIVGG
ncbi:MAG TPA: hypothetical protein VNA67_02285 [Pseudonocardiaceae bacterium]|nr:hypothetical protein [Pseudonocardiaceae bacterium]